MPVIDWRKEAAKQQIDAVNKALKEGHPPENRNDPTIKSAARVAADELGMNRDSFVYGVGTPSKLGKYYHRYGLSPDWSLYRSVAESLSDVDNSFSVDHTPPPAYTGGSIMELVSSADNRFIFGAAGDLHAASKYCRWDVREDLYNWFIEEGAQCSFDTGNWIDGEASFSKYDIEVTGLDRQVKLLSEQHPKGLMTCAVWGDDHEGWYVQREGIDVGRYAESVMQQAGHEWVNLGYIEAHVLLRNANSGKAINLSIAHPGGGSAYALSYSIQRIIESLEGGEKPGVALYGHYHKLWAGLIRNVWVAQTGTQQDQTPFQRKKRIEAHVGGMLITLHQDPKTGAITRFKPEIARYFNTSYYGGSQRWSKHGAVILPKRERS